MLSLQQGRLSEAIAQWRAALAEHPGFKPALEGLSELSQAQLS